MAEVSSGTVMARDREGQELPVVWRTIVEIPLDGRLHHHTRGSLDEAHEQIAARFDRLRRAGRIIETIRDLSGADGWDVTISAGTVRLERSGVPFESLDEELSGRFDPADYAVRVEYARAWGML